MLRPAQREEVGRAIRSILLALGLVEAEQLLDETVARYTTTAPDLAHWREANLPEGFTLFALPACQRRVLRTSNLLEPSTRSCGEARASPHSSPTWPSGSGSSRLC